MQPPEKELAAMEIHVIANKEGECTRNSCMRGHILPNKAYRDLLHGWLQPVDNRRLGAHESGRYAELSFSSTRSFRPFYPLPIRQMLGGLCRFNALERGRYDSKRSVVLILLYSHSSSPSLLRALPRG